MTADRWFVPAQPGWIPAHTVGPVKFASYEGMASGVMTIPDESLLALRTPVSPAAPMSNGSIEFDIKPLEYGDTGLVFDRQGNDRGEFLYLRANPDCPAASDCIQYAPIAHGLMPWNIYSAEQGPAPINPAGWNHVRIVLAASGMEVFVNRVSEPTLVVPRLLSGADGGGLAFKGPASYANLVIRPGDIAGFVSLGPARVPAGTVTSWVAAPPTAIERDRGVNFSDRPGDSVWTALAAGPDGLLDYGRAFAPLPGSATSTGWVRFSLRADMAGRRMLRLGFAQQATVFLNGEPVYAGSNDYFPEAHRLSPDGRLEPDNATIPVDLRPGINTITVAVGNLWRSHDGMEKPTPYGWGIEARILDMTGLHWVF